MELEIVLNKLANSLGIPSVIVPLFFLLRMFKPLSFFSANVVEQRMFSKERIFYFKAFKHVFYTFFWMSTLFSTAFYLKDFVDWEPNNVYFYLVLVVGELVWFFIFLINQDALHYRTVSFVKNNRLIKSLLVIIFMGCLWSVYMPFYQLLLLSFETSTLMIGISIGTIFIVTSFIPFILRPISRLIKWSTVKTVYIRDKEQGRKWFVLYAINQDTVLLGDSSEVKACKENMIMKIEDLYNRPIKIEENK
ncbi:hypothetical protein [Bacillus swezeyi]|uniref:Uncharacterized protein n=1 Tax=Bacillus swezeyi TaxID=1925020 RepID=A0A5M8RMH3_9BACI|nr:hypothetical protein [Bacillus swezeyi]KAA6448580.1 hypothetical protein DX927_18620 [Bacillus swezeyi]TYS34891.1 hypothetical protein FZC77_15625 [Bacillus swezeyi]